MNLENIQAGMRVPNYRKLCDLLGEPIEEGNSKNAQIRRWEQYFAYSREKMHISSRRYSRYRIRSKTSE